jgi:hypothetical protein
VARYSEHGNEVRIAYKEDCFLASRGNVSLRKPQVHEVNVCQLFRRAGVISVSKLA